MYKSSRTNFILPEMTSAPKQTLCRFWSGFDAVAAKKAAGAFRFEFVGYGKPSLSQKPAEGKLFFFSQRA